MDVSERHNITSVVFDTYGVVGLSLLNSATFCIIECFEERRIVAAEAKRAVKELASVKMRGNKCGLMPLEENDTKFLGNITAATKMEVNLYEVKNEADKNEGLKMDDEGGNGLCSCLQPDCMLVCFSFFVNYVMFLCDLWPMRFLLYKRSVPPCK
ncbi:hypothetical protein SUGI_1140070 [Cryptomeria japonica]|nr:hypothetical protein SUGI_1140070 [Cryptomeria japonica]